MIVRSGIVDGFRGPPGRLFAVWALFALVNASPGVAPAQQSTPPAADSPVADTGGAAEVDGIGRDGELPSDRSWEYSHYRVRVWVCSDGSASAESVVAALPAGLAERAELIDPSGWELLVAAAPARWRWPALAGIAEPARLLSGIGLSPLLKHDTKLMLVTLRQSASQLDCGVRELDLTTNQWGALLRRPLPDRDAAVPVILEMIRTAFMPLARIDRVTEENTAYLRARGARLCERVRFDPELDGWAVQPNTGSPVRVRDDDVFMPVLRRTDRDNKLVSQDPVEFTFIKVDPAGPPPAEGAAGEEPAARLTTDGSLLFGKVFSMYRAPLVARKSKRLEKLALVIRPPSQSSQLKLVAQDNPQRPMEGVEVWSRPLGAKKEDGITFICKSDWRGIAEIPPAAEGIRMLLLRRGTRNLQALPVMPGLVSLQTVAVVNDETRLFAEGVVQGMGNEILDTVAQREIYQKLIKDMLDSDDPKKIEKATASLAEYEKLPRPANIQARLANEKSRLLAQTRDRREAGFIEGMFRTLESALSTFLGRSRETEIRQQIQELSGLGAATSGRLAPAPGGEAAQPAAEAPGNAPAADSENPPQDTPAAPQTPEGTGDP